MPHRYTRRHALKITLTAALTTGITGCSENVEPSGSTNNPGQDWPLYRFDPANTGVNSDATAPNDPVSTAWTFDTGHWANPPSIFGDTIYVCDEILYALDRTGVKQWEADVSANGAAVTDDTVYAGAGHSGAVAIDASSGEQDWSQPIGWVMPPTLVDQSLYVATTGGEVRRLSTSDGTTQWKVSVDFQIQSPPAVTDDMVIVASRARNTDTAEGYVRALDIQNGDEKWQVKTGGVAFSAPAVNDSTVFVPDRAGTVYALDITDGSERWSVGTDGTFTSPPAVTGEAVYVGSQEGRLYAYETADGTERWTVTDVGFINSGPTVAEQTVYLATNKGLFAFASASGDRRWQVSPDRSLFGVVVSGGTIFTGSVVSADEQEAGKRAKVFAFES